MINFMYMIENTIAQLFTQAVGRWQNGEIGSDGKPTERKALLVLFRIKKVLIQMLIHAPANYVGVYTRKEKEKWDCLVYHDSCWVSSSGIHSFLWENREDIQFRFFFPLTSGWDVIKSITRSIHVVQLSKEQLNELKQVRKKKYS